MEPLLFISIFLSFILTLIVLPKWIRQCKNTGLVWEDMNKYGHPRNVAACGGIVVVMAFVLGVLSYIALRTFVFSGNGTSLEIFAVLSVMLLLAIIGFTDDFLGWKSRGLSAKFRLLLALVASIPLVVINAGTHIMNVPLLGAVNLGIIYPLVIIPLGIAGAATTFNFLAGFNGLESGQGILIIGFLSFVAYATGSPWLALIGLCMLASLIVFYFYNKFPAKVFPGDTLTYAMGGLIAIMAILGNFEKIALFVFIPYIIETGLKLRGGLRKSSFGVPDKDGNLRRPYKKIYGVEHLAILILSKFKKKVHEKEVVYLIWLFQILIILLAFLML